VWKSLVALDTDHIKGYVFGTDKLKEIRGASSILDRLNREEMNRIVHEADPGAKTIYANGGSGLFLVASDKVDKIKQQINSEFYSLTFGGATVTFAVQDIPDSIDDHKHADIGDVLELLRYQLREEKESRLTHDHIGLSSHAFMRTCDSCGMRYAEVRDKDEGQDPALQGNRYCKICYEKRIEDDAVKASIKDLVSRKKPGKSSPLWEKIIEILLKADYQLPEGTNRPDDFNVFHNFGEAKDYIGLIYADANNMGDEIKNLRTLERLKSFADKVDLSIYQAVCDAIQKHLPVRQLPEQKQHDPTKSSDNSNSPKWVFPFDILLLGGDDLVMVTPASSAMDVALTTAKRFNELTKGWGPEGKGYTLSVGVILAPIKYPFGLLQDLAETTLKAAKQKRGKQEKQEEKKGQKEPTAFGDTSINFMVVSGNTSHDFDKVYKQLQNKDVQNNGYDSKVNLYATLRPYTVEELDILLDAIRDGRNKSLGRTKLHQVREAVLKMNLTTSVGESLAVLRNWKQSQREFVYNHVYKLGSRYQEWHQDSEKPGTLFPRVTFPWFADGDNAYRTSLLDFVELYDFVTSEKDSGTED
jgi:CRISPR/Cas system-associated protein Cas10 (large subunit of type III CRISPR-Cas system)